MKEIITKDINDHLEVANTLHKLTEKIYKSAEICITSLNNGGKILLCGNGGSAADAQHIAAELIGRYKLERKGIPAIAITTDTSSITSIGNDYGFGQVFERQIEAIANEGDIVIGISTSGQSENVINALNLAKTIGCLTIGFTGGNSGKMNAFCDINLTVSSEDTARIQEMHIILGHIICNLIERELMI
jgi:D-sedoheptulose 7-phosphate isomerase